jgi:hypothetical protein
MRASAGLSLLGMHSAAPGPFSARKFRTIDDPGELLDGVPFTHGLPLNEGQEQFFDPCHPLFQGSLGIDRRRLYWSRR